MKVKCPICGKIEINDHFEDYEGAMRIPVEICPTIQSVGKYYKKIVGDTYEYLTGNKISEGFDKRMITPSHECIDDIGWDEAKKHQVEPIECWYEIT